MQIIIKQKRPSPFWYYFWQMLYLIPIVVTFHYCKILFVTRNDFRYNPVTNLEVSEPTPAEVQCQLLSYEMAHLQREIFYLKQELEELQSWKRDQEKNLDLKLSAAFDGFYSDQIGLFDYAAEYAGGYIIATPNTVSYPSKYGLRLFGAFDWTVNSQPNLLLQHEAFPGKCYAFYGNKGRIRIGLSQPVMITHVSLEHIRLGESLTSVPRDFQVLGLGESGEENLGYFVYELEDSVIQTFRVIPRNQTFSAVELRILSNYGNDELTCVYRFRVHSLNLNLK